MSSFLTRAQFARLTVSVLGAAVAGCTKAGDSSDDAETGAEHGSCSGSSSTSTSGSDDISTDEGTSDGDTTGGGEETGGGGSACNEDLDVMFDPNHPGQDAHTLVIAKADIDAGVEMTIDAGWGGDHDEQGPWPALVLRLPTQSTRRCTSKHSSCADRDRPDCLSSQIRPLAFEPTPEPRG